MIYRARVSAASGGGRLVRTAGECLFVPADSTTDAVATGAFVSLFRSALAGGDGASVTDYVLEHQDDTPPFVWLSWSDSQHRSVDSTDIRLMVRGDVTVTTDIESVPTLSGVGSATWVEHRVRRCPESAEIRVGDAADPSTDLVDGTVAAGGIRVRLDETSAAGRSTSGAEANPDPAGAGPNISSGPQSAVSRTAVTSARACPSGHANPPHLVRCRLCDAGIDQETDTITVRSPVLAVARFDDETSVDLCETKVFGRQPDGDRARLMLPHQLVAMKAPASVSRTHLVISASGWALTVTDCHSSGGTVLSPAEQSDPKQLEAWIPHELSVGDVLHLGGTTTITIEEPTA